MIAQMSLVLAALLVVFLPFSTVHGYLEKYKTPQTPSVDCNKAATVLSWHVHVTYMLTNDEQIKEVQELRDEAMKYFAPLLGEDPICRGTSFDPSGRYDNGRFCFIYDHDLTNDTLGPFAVGEWSVWVPVHSFSAVVPWFTQHRGQYNLLVHPNTGCEYEDHSIWAQWTGSPWNMDMSIFTKATQTNEFGEVVGTVRNPACAAKQEVCAFGESNAASYVPSVLCCAGTSCNCDGASNTGKCLCK